MKTLLQIDGVDAFYGAAHILHRMTLEVKEGERVALIGRNGVGKTTVVNTVLGLAAMKGGAIHMNGKHIARPRTYMAAQNGIAVVGGSLGSGAAGPEHARSRSCRLLHRGRLRHPQFPRCHGPAAARVPRSGLSTPTAVAAGPRPFVGGFEPKMPSPSKAQRVACCHRCTQPVASSVLNRSRFCSLAGSTMCRTASATAASDGVNTSFASVTCLG